jgi:hypothetical protein
MRFDIDDIVPLFFGLIMIAFVLVIIATPFLMYYNPCLYKTCVIIQTESGLSASEIQQAKDIKELGLIPVVDNK